VLLRSALALLVVSLGLVLLHTGYYYCRRHAIDAWLRDPICSLDSNTGFAQAFTSAQTLLLIGLLLRTAGRTREVVYAALAGVFVLVLLDDALAINQWLGGPLVRLLGLVDHPRLLAQSLAEMMVYAALGVPVVALLGTSWRRAAPVHRRLGAAFILLIGVLAFFATAMDLVHLAFIKSFYASPLVLEVAEEGGEMATLSAALLLALAIRGYGSAPSATPAFSRYCWWYSSAR
jgi:hypothetical protein